MRPGGHGRPRSSSCRPDPNRGPRRTPAFRASSAFPAAPRQPFERPRTQAPAVSPNPWRHPELSSPKHQARIAGLLYLIVAVFAAFAFNYATGRTYVPGNAAATAQSVLANGGLVRAGVVADLIQATAWIFTAMALYLLLRHVNENLARAMVIFVAVGATIVFVNQVFRLPPCWSRPSTATRPPSAPQDRAP